MARNKTQQAADKRAELFGSILDELERSCSSFCLDNDEEVRKVAEILTARLERRGVKLT